jgi:hypothetical protein
LILEKVILYSIWVISTGSIFFIPRNKRRLALVAFLFKQAITWLLGLVVVEFGLIKYPVRFFSEVNRTSFTFEFYVYPVICGIFNVFYPTKRSRFIQLGYFYVFPTVMTIGEVIFEKYTDLIKYIHWHWFLSWLTLLITFYITRIFCVWFFKEEIN